MRQGPRISREERKERILEAVSKVFSRKGLEAASSKELAREAGISEALLYQHFRSKEELYRAMLDSCANAWLGSARNKVLSLAPSTSGLVTIVYFLVSRLLSPHPVEAIAIPRFILRSMAGDGKFARTAYYEFPIVPKLEECIKAAIAAGDIERKSGLPRLQAWFAHHVAVGVMYDFLPSIPLVDYGVSREKLIDQTVLFALRGTGLKEKAIRRYYDPKELALLAA